MSEPTTTEAKVEYEITTFTLKPDFLGPNKATLLHARTTKNDGQFYKAVLYIHGYSDYFFQDHISIEFLEHGYDFFALDLRKCGRSIISPGQDYYRHYFNDIHEYDEEVTLSIEHIINEAKTKPKKLVLLGHSTGGLIASLYVASGPKRQDIDVLVLNSPYLATLETSLVESVLINTLSTLGLSTYIPDNGYNRSIHKSEKGEWDFDATKKPVDKIRAHGSSMHAIRVAQHDLLSRGSCIKCPTLLMCSSRTIKPDKIWRDEYFEADLLLNVISMRQAASTMSQQITIYEIEQGMHDIFLSKAPVREKAFHLMFNWLKQIETNWM